MKLKSLTIILLAILAFVAWWYWDSIQYDKDVNEEDHLVIMNKNISALSLKPVKDRPKTLTAIFKELELAGARMSEIPVFKTFEEARAFGLAHQQDDAIIHRLFEKACEYKRAAMMSNLKYALDEYLRYKAAWESARFGIRGARLAKTVLKVIDLATGTGEAMPGLKKWLEKRGFWDVWIIGIDNGNWLEDADLPKPTQEMKKEIVKISDAVLQNKHGNDYHVLYGDAMGHFPPEMIHDFDIVFLNAPPLNMTVSFVYRSLRLIKPDGVIVLRYEKDARNFMNLQTLISFAKEHDLSVSLAFCDDMPEGNTKLGKTVYIIKHGQFAWQSEPLSAMQVLERDLNGARMVTKAT